MTTLDVKRWKPDGAHLYECDSQGAFIPVAVPISAAGGHIGQTVSARRIRFFDSASSNLVDGKDYDALQAELDALKASIREATMSLDECRDGVLLAKPDDVRASLHLKFVRAVDQLRALAEIVK